LNRHLPFASITADQAGRYIYLTAKLMLHTVAHAHVIAFLSRYQQMSVELL
jgi:hypothetical protein